MQRCIKFLIFLLLLSGCSEKTASGKRTVAVSIQPLADLTQRIGGERVEVFTIIPAGSNPHTFELTPVMMSRISRADLLVLNGAGLEFWAENVCGVSAEKKIVVTAEGWDILEEEEEHHAHGNPHIWLDPIAAQHQARRIFEALVEIDPAGRPYFEANLAALIQALEELNTEIAREIATWKQRQFVCFHPSWVYFAHRYGLVQAAVIEKRPGQEQSPQEIADLIRTVNRIGVRAVFAEAQFPTRIAEVIARESGIRVVTLDPLGSTPETASYFDLLRRNVEAMAQVMRE